MTLSGYFMSNSIEMMWNDPRLNRPPVGGVEDVKCMGLKI